MSDRLRAAECETHLVLFVKRMCVCVGIFSPPQGRLHGDDNHIARKQPVRVFCTRARLRRPRAVRCARATLRVPIRSSLGQPFVIQPGAEIVEALLDIVWVVPVRIGTQV